MLVKLDHETPRFGVKMKKKVEPQPSINIPASSKGCCSDPRDGVWAPLIIHSAPFGVAGICLTLKLSLFFRPLFCSLEPSDCFYKKTWNILRLLGVFFGNTKYHNPKDHWTLKTGYFEDPTPAIQVQTLPLEGPRSLGKNISLLYGGLVSW